MANLKTCSRCKSEIDISYFGINRKKEPYKTCVNCRSKPKKTSITLKRSDTDFVDGSVSSNTNHSNTTNTDDWKTLFGVPNSTHPDFRSFLLSQGWQEVQDTASLMRD